MNLRCWWFGCKPYPEGWRDQDYDVCVHCDRDIPYADLVGDTRHERLKGRLSRLSPLRLLPRKCFACGARFKCVKDCDGIPF